MGMKLIVVQNRVDLQLHLKHDFKSMAFSEIANFLVYFSTYFIILPVLVGVFFYKKNSPEMNILLLYSILTFIVDLLLLIDTDLHNTFLYFFSILDLVFFSILFLKFISPILLKKMLILICICIVLFLIFDSIYYSGFTSNGISNSIVKGYLLCISVLFFNQIITKNIDRNLLLEPMLYVALGVILYNLVGLFDFFAGQVSSFSPLLLWQYYAFWAVLTIMMYFLFAYAFWPRKIKKYII